MGHYAFTRRYNIVLLFELLPKPLTDESRGLIVCCLQWSFFGLASLQCRQQRREEQRVPSNGLLRYCCDVGPCLLT